MRKPTICISENKDADQLCSYISCVVTAQLISAFVFATWTVQFLYFLNPKFQAYSHLLCLYRPVYVGPVWKPQCWFSHKMAQMIFLPPIREPSTAPMSMALITNSWYRQDKQKTSRSWRIAPDMIPEYIKE